MNDALGLGRLLPGPGWLVIDAAREQRFTGEVVLLADEAVRVYFDRGRVYLAERSSAPPLSARLVESGALSEQQLEYGRLQIHDADHLGRLFDRVPNVSRDSVLTVTDLMNEQTLAWLANQIVQSAGVAPYRHHSSGLHHWLDAPATPLAAPWPAPTLTVPGMPPAGPIDESSAPSAASADQPATPGTPASVEPAATPAANPAPTEPTATPAANPAPTEPAATPTANPASAEPAASPAPTATPSTPADPPPPAGSVPSVSPSPQPGGVDTTVDEIVTWEVPDPFGDAAGRLGPQAEPIASGGDESAAEFFGVIWPTGEVDDVGTTVRAGEPPAPSGDPGLATNPPPAHDHVAQPSDDPDTLAVRRAVATIDTGSLAARRRLLESTQPAAPPVMRDDTRPSVFDEPHGESEPDEPLTEREAEHLERARALRRMISGLRRE